MIRSKFEKKKKIHSYKSKKGILPTNHVQYINVVYTYYGANIELLNIGGPYNTMTKRHKFQFIK